jgi:DNA-binding PadR family transcriptional regulator
MISKLTRAEKDVLSQLSSDSNPQQNARQMAIGIFGDSIKLEQPNIRLIRNALRKLIYLELVVRERAGLYTLTGKGQKAFKDNIDEFIASPDMRKKQKDDRKRLKMEKKEKKEREKIEKSKSETESKEPDNVIAIEDRRSRRRRRHSG